MKNIKRLVATVMIGVMGFAVMGCSMIEKTPEAIKNTVVAKVNGEKITKGEVDQELKSYIDQYKTTYGEDFEKDAKVKAELDEYRKQVIENLVSEKVLIMKAKELNLVPSDEELNKEIDAKVAELVKLYGSEEELQKAKDSFGYTDETFKEFMKNQVIAQKAIDYIHKDITSTDEEIKEYYDKNATTFTTNAGAEMFHILVKTEDEAKAVKQRLDNGESYADIAKELNEDSTSETGGSLGFVEYEAQNFDADFLAAAKELKEGEISGPVKTQFGYHIIKVAGVQTETRVKPLEEVKDSIKTEVEKTKKNEAYTEKIEEWKKELDVKLYLDKL